MRVIFFEILETNYDQMMMDKMVEELSLQEEELREEIDAIEEALELEEQDEEYALVMRKIRSAVR